jgi:hypothetical protein
MYFSHLTTHLHLNIIESGDIIQIRAKVTPCAIDMLYAPGLSHQNMMTEGKQAFPKDKTW